MDLLRNDKADIIVHSVQEERDKLESVRWTKLEVKGSIPSLQCNYSAHFIQHPSIKDGFYLFDTYNTRLHFFNLSTCTWRQVPLLNNPEKKTIGTFGSTCAVYKDCFYVFGGYFRRSRNDFHECNIFTKKLVKIENRGRIPAGRHWHSACIYKDKYYIFAGFDGVSIRKDMHAYDFISKEWEEVAYRGLPPRQRYSHSSLLFMDDWYIYGGCSERYLIKFNFPSRRWDTIEVIGRLPLLNYCTATLCPISHTMYIWGVRTFHEMMDLVIAYNFATEQVKYFSIQLPFPPGYNHITCTFQEEIYLLYFKNCDYTASHLFKVNIDHFGKRVINSNEYKLHALLKSSKFTDIIIQCN